jgi:heterodisulfide reductase subunit C
MNELNKSKIFSDFADQVAGEPGGEGIRKCFSCGTCSAGCPIRRINDLYNPRKIIRMILLGMKNRVLESDFIWLCSSCYTCQERCPQDVRITDLMIATRNLACQHGYTPSGIKMQADLIESQGRLYLLDEFDDKKRKKAGLPSLPFTIDEVTRLLEE